MIINKLTKNAEKQLKEARAVFPLTTKFTVGNNDMQF